MTLSGLISKRYFECSGLLPSKKNLKIENGRSIDYQYQITSSGAFKDSAEQITSQGRTASFSVRGVIAISSDRKHSYIALEVLSCF